jgi:hypothetical protein
VLWFRKRPEAAEVERDLIEPMRLEVELDPALFRSHMSMLVEAAQADGGVEGYLESLTAKHRLFAEALGEASLDALEEGALDALLETVFTARRKLHPVLAEFGLPKTLAALRELLHGNGPLEGRIGAFVGVLPIRAGEGREARNRAARLTRAAHDFAAECLHFRDPVRYPLMTRWMWDESTMSGAVREFVKNPDQRDRLPIDGRPETFEAVRGWLAAEIERQGIYRDVPLWVDLVAAGAYTHYFRSMTGGVLGSDFQRTGGPEEQVKKLLGIDGERRGGRSRVKRDETVKGAA